MNETPAVDIASTSAPGKLCRTTASTYCEMAVVAAIRSLRQEAVLRPLRMEHGEPCWRTEQDHCTAE